MATVSWASFLLVPITPDGPRLIQPTAYWPGTCSPRLWIGHPAALVGDHAAALVERDPVQPDALVADRAEDEPALDRLALAGVASADRARLVAVELVTGDDQALDLAVTLDLHG